jgi:hypothetical protein
VEMLSLKYKKSSKEDILKESKITLFEIFRNILIFNIKK